MAKDYKKIIGQMIDIAKDGNLGIEIEKTQKEYEKIDDNIACIIKYIYDVLTPKSENDLEITKSKAIFAQYIIVAYRESKKNDSEIAEALLYSFIEDFPSISNSCLLEKWRTFAESILSVKEIYGSKKRLELWQNYSRLFQAYNEFLNGLLSYLILCWKCHLGEAADLSIFGFSYGDKIKEFEKITNGENGLFYLIFRVAKNQIRNAIAHGDIRFDSDAGIIYYLVGKKEKKEKQVDLDEFMATTLLGSTIAQAYLAGIGTIVVMEHGTEKAKVLLPDFLKKAFEFKSESKAA
jgi:hypothetical protein